MPNIREQRVDASGIYIKASDGREITLTKGQILALTLPHLPDKAVAVMRVKQAIENALGAEQVPVTRRVTPSKPNPDYDPAVTDMEDVRSQTHIPDYDNAYDQDAIEFDFDESDGTPLTLGLS